MSGLRIAAAFLLALLWALAGSAARAQGAPLTLSDAEQAWIRAHPVVHVGMATEFPPYYFGDKQGRYEGFVVDLMERLAQRAGVRVEYRRYARFSEVLEALQRGEIDMTPFTSETPSRRAYLQFVRPLFSTQMVYVSDRRLGDVDADARFSGYRVAVERDSVASEMMQAGYPQAKLQLYGSTEEALLATAAGDADVYVGFRQVAVYFMEKHLTANLVLRGTLATQSTALGPAVRKGLPELAGLLERAIDDLNTDEIAAVAAKWLPRTVLGAVPRPDAVLSDAQRQWVRMHGNLRLGFDADFAPIAFTGRAGGFEGMAADVAHAVAGKVGLIVAVEEGGSFATVYQRALSGDLDVIVGAARNSERARDFDFVGPFVRMPTVIVAANDRDLDSGLAAPGRQRLALLRSHFLIPLLRSRYPRLALQEYGSQAEVLGAVRRGEADLAIGNLKVVTRIVESQHLGALRVIGTVPDGDSELYFAVRKSMPELAGVLRAGLDAVTRPELDAIEGRWLHVRVNEGVPWARVLTIGSVAIALAALVIGSLWLANRRLRAAQQALQHARRLAEEQVAARAGFTAYLSHELRGTLSGIVAGFGMMQSGRLAPDRQAQFVAAMRDSSASLLDLCERTLDFERMLHGGVDVRPAPARLRDVVDAALAPWRVQAETKGLWLRSDLRIDADTVFECDAVRLTQVLQNLVGNAVKFTTVGGVSVDAEVQPPDADGRAWLRVEVADSGPGIADADRARLFEAFAQGAAGRDTRRGAGLGLSISAAIVEAMGGHIGLQSTSAAGSVFVVRVPLRC